MSKKLRVGVLFGGRSGEHEVSLLSGASILKAIDQKKYEVVPIGITKQGRWVTANDASRLLAGETAKKLAPENLTGVQSQSQPRAGDPAATASAAVLQRGDAVIIPPVPSQGGLQPLEVSAHSNPAQAALALDVIFPVLHGTFGEDGTIQGLFELADIAYVGSGVLGSATGMDKDVMKRLFRASGLPITPHVTLLRGQWEADPMKCRKLIERELRYPLFVKPANLGSSVGISKVHGRKELPAAMDLAGSYDRKIVVEQGVGGRERGGSRPRELEVAVLGNDAPEASVVGEIVPSREFYDYEAKYLSEGSVPIIPAKLSKAESRKIREMAIAAFRACDCAGLARVDFLMEPGTKTRPARVYVNEINTLPGFTSISMYPKLWEASGMPYKQLIDRLIQLALERHREKQQTQFSRE
jgi:D-alanine-D-alanine ligase